MRIVIGEGSCGIAAGAKKVHEALGRLNADGAVSIGITGCIGACFLEPIVDVYDGDQLVKRLVKVQEKDAARIYQATLDAARSASAPYQCLALIAYSYHNQPPIACISSRGRRGRARACIRRPPRSAR